MLLSRLAIFSLFRFLPPHHGTSRSLKKWMQLCLASLVTVLWLIAGFVKTGSGIGDSGFINRCQLIQPSCQIVANAKRLPKPIRN